MTKITIVDSKVDFCVKIWKKIIFVCENETFVRLSNKVYLTYVIRSHGELSTTQAPTDMRKKVIEKLKAMFGFPKADFYYIWSAF